MLCSAPLLWASQLAPAAPRRPAGDGQAAKERRLPAAKRRQAEARQDEDDFAAEYTLLRKLKRGRISEARPPCCLLQAGPLAPDYGTLAVSQPCTAQRACTTSTIPACRCLEQNMPRSCPGSLKRALVLQVGSAHTRTIAGTTLYVCMSVASVDKPAAAGSMPRTPSRRT